MKKKTIFITLIGLIVALGFSELKKPGEVNTLLFSRYQVQSNITYSVGSNYECKLDVYFPRTPKEPRPTLMYIHGGGWVVGAKDAAVLCLLPYLEMGFSVVNVEYRMARTALAPGAVEDCRLALRWIFIHANEYKFDTSKIVVSGDSAGGHLALMTGMLTAAAGFDYPKEWTLVKPQLKVAAIINWYGITDVQDLIEGKNTQDYALSWIGSQANPLDIAKRVSPLTYLRKDLPPILTIHGDKDELVPYTHATRLHQSLDKLRVSNELITIPGANHGGFNREEILMIYEKIRLFLKKHLSH